MRRNRVAPARRLVVTSLTFLVSVSLLCHCGISDSTSGTETHWLRSCQDDEQCGSLKCVCGVCSLPCSTSLQCEGTPVASQCVSPGAAPDATQCASEVVGFCGHAQLSSGAGGSGGTGASGTPGASATTGDPQPEDQVSPSDGGAPSTEGDSLVTENGWTWDVACPDSVENLCQSDTPCVPVWNDARHIETWCENLDITGFAYAGQCNGYNVVSVFGIDTSGQDPQLLNSYYYDSDTGSLVRVDSNAVPSYTRCVAGRSGERFDQFGCNSEYADCR